MVLLFTFLLLPENEVTVWRCYKLGRSRLQVLMPVYRLPGETIVALQLLVQLLYEYELLPAAGGSGVSTGSYSDRTSWYTCCGLHSSKPPFIPNNISDSGEHPWFILEIYNFCDRRLSARKEMYEKNENKMKKTVKWKSSANEGNASFIALSGEKKSTINFIIPSYVNRPLANNLTWD